MDGYDKKITYTCIVDNTYSYSFHVQLPELLHVPEDGLFVLRFLREGIAIERDLRQTVGLPDTGDVIEAERPRSCTFR